MPIEWAVVVVRLVGLLVFGGLIVLLASSNAHMAETRLGPIAMKAPHLIHPANFSRSEAISGDISRNTSTNLGSKCLPASSLIMASAFSSGQASL